MRVINYVETFSYNSYIPAYCTKKEETSNIYFYRNKLVSLCKKHVAITIRTTSTCSMVFDVNEVKLQNGEEGKLIIQDLGINTTALNI